MDGICKESAEQDGAYENNGKYKQGAYGRPNGHIIIFLSVTFMDYWLFATM